VSGLFHRTTMKIIGLTGGIASGKSTVTRMFAALGAQIASADTDARAVLEDPALLAQVFALFPETRTPENTLHRAALGQRIFADPAARARLEAILHPAIFARMQATIAAARPDTSTPALIYEVPLLYEKNRETLFDTIIAVLSTPAKQAERLQEREAAANRPALTPEQITERLHAQLPPEEKAKRANHVIRTDTTLEQTKEQVEQVWQTLTGTRNT